MDERQQQLVAAAEAMRTWVYKQRAMWAQEYSQSLVHGQPQLASAAATAIALPPVALPSAVAVDTPTLPAEPWTDTDAGSSVSPGIAERLESTVQGTTTFVRTSWRMLAAIAAIVLVVAGVRFAWPGMRAKVASNRTATDASAGKPTQNQKGDGGRGGAAAVVPTAKAGGRLQVDSSPAGAHVLIDGKDRGVTPLTVEDLAVGSHKVMIRADDGSVQRTVSIASGEVVHLNESIYSGWLHVTAPFEVQLSEGRKPITLDDSNQVLLSAGPHDVRIEKDRKSVV